MKDQCDQCESENTTKVIGMAMPMHLCIDCGAIWGFFSYIYFIFAFIESLITGGYCELMGYDEPYWQALKAWLKGPDHDDKP